MTSSRAAARLVGRVDLALAAAISFIAIATLIPKTGLQTTPTFWCALCDDRATVDIVLNVLLFAPYGAAAARRGWTSRRTTAVAFAMTCAAETLQFLVVQGRDPSARDILTNTAGGALGWTLWSSGALSLWPTRRQATRLAIAGLAGWLSIITLTSWSQQLAFPESRYYGQRAPELGQYEVFRGTVLSGEFGGAVLPTGPIADSKALRNHLLSEGATAHALLVPAREPPGIAPIISMFDDAHRRIFVLGRDHRDAVFEVRLRADELRMRSPTFEMHDGIPSTGPRRAVDVRAKYEHGNVTISSTLDSATRTTLLHLGPGSGWGLMLPVAFVIDERATFVNVVWLFVLTLPVAFWCAWLGRRRAYLVVVPVAGLIIVPLALHVSPADAWEWSATFAACVVGQLAALLLESSRERTEMTEATAARPASAA